MIQDFARLIFLASITTIPLNSASTLSTVAAWETETGLRRNRNVWTLVTAWNAKDESSKATRFIVLLTVSSYYIIFSGEEENSSEQSG